MKCKTQNWLLSKEKLFQADNFTDRMQRLMFIKTDGHTYFQTGLFHRHAHLNLYFMYDSSSLIQSKNTFQIQKYGNAIRSQLRDSSDQYVSELNDCCRALTSDLVQYDDAQILERQIQHLERFKFNIAKFSALLPLLPHVVIVFPSAEEMKRFTNAFYLELIDECARKKNHYKSLVETEKIYTP